MLELQQIIGDLIFFGDNMVFYASVMWDDDGH